MKNRLQKVFRICLEKVPASYINNSQGFNNSHATVYLYDEYIYDIIYLLLIYINLFLKIWIYF